MNPVRFVSGGAVTAVLLALLAYQSAVPLAFHSSSAARLRLSWSARPERIEVCRAVSAEEQAKREEHMRQRVVCDGGFATYLLRIEIDSQLVGESVVRGAGLRHDRPLYLLRDYAVPQGPHRVRVTLTRREKSDGDTATLVTAIVPGADTGLYAGRAQRETSERARRVRAAIPPSLVLDTALVFVPRRVVLVTLNAARRALELHAETGGK